jgi:tripartite-type tricarboxylate transporter receptor subunit TctC
MLSRRSLLLSTVPLVAAAAGIGTRSALAQTIGDGRPLRLVVPFPAGGAVDILGRLIADRLKTILGQSVVVDNRGGAGGLLGADNVAKSTPDGTTLGLIGVTTLCAYPFLYSRMPFDPIADLLPVTEVSNGSLLCVVNADTAARHGWKDFRTLIEWARAHPEEVRMGSSGTGTTSHLTISAVNAGTAATGKGARILHVPYRGGGPAINDVVSGQIDMMFDVMPALMPHVEGGKLKALAVSSRERLAMLPDVPGMKEFADLGLADVDVQSWQAIMVAAKTPPEVVDRLFKAVREAMNDATLRERLRPSGYEVVVSDSPAALTAQIKDETPRWKRLVELSGAKLD